MKANPTAESVLPIPQEAFDWYDEYAHGIIDRRTFMGQLTTLSGAGLTMGAGQIIGAKLGTGLVVKRGARFVRPVFLIMVTLTLGRLIYLALTQT